MEIGGLGDLGMDLMLTSSRGYLRDLLDGDLKGEKYILFRFNLPKDFTKDISKKQMVDILKIAYGNKRYLGDFLDLYDEGLDNFVVMEDDHPVILEFSNYDSKKGDGDIRILADSMKGGLANLSKLENILGSKLKLKERIIDPNHPENLEGLEAN